jgi:hypothetical protein
MEPLWVTTLDNPFNYFTDFDNWYRFDTDHSYNTCGYVARQAELLGYSSEMSENRQTELINEAVERICQLNLLGIYKKITKDSIIKPVKIDKILQEEV